MLTPTQLKAIREVVATGSLRAAATSLGYSPSAVSQQISSIERLCGVPLLERSSRSIRPTAAGTQLARLATRILSELDSVEEEMRAFASSERGRLHVGSFWSAGYRLVPAVLLEILQGRPDVDLRYEEGDWHEVLPQVLDGGLDIAVVAQYGTVPRSYPSEIEARLILEEPLYLLLPSDHRLAKRQEIRVSDLADERWICAPDETDAAGSLHHICAAAGFRPEIIFRTDDYKLPFELVRNGLGVAIVPQLAIPESWDVSLIRLANPTHVRKVYLVHRAVDTNPLIRSAEAALRRAATNVEQSIELHPARVFAL